VNYDAQLLRVAPQTQLLCNHATNFARRGMPVGDLVAAVAAFICLFEPAERERILSLIDDPVFNDHLYRLRHMKNRDSRKNSHFLYALRQLPCLRCQKRNPEAAHIRLTSQEWTKKTGVPTGAGGAQKPADRWALPLCASCHREGPEAEHLVGTKEFYRRWGVDPHLIADALWHAYPNTDSMLGVAARVLHFGFGKVES
jgi:hypothetical protein